MVEDVRRDASEAGRWTVTSKRLQYHYTNKVCGRKTEPPKTQVLYTTLIQPSHQAWPHEHTTTWYTSANTEWELMCHAISFLNHYFNYSFFSIWSESMQCSAHETHDNTRVPQHWYEMVSSPKPTIKLKRSTIHYKRYSCLLDIRQIYLQRMDDKDIACLVFHHTHVVKAGWTTSRQPRILSVFHYTQKIT